MNIRTELLAEQVSRARARGWTAIMRKAEKRHDLPAGLLLAVASRETDMEDIVGDKGHGRGLFQIDDRFHADWLAAHGAPGPATTPRIEDAAEFAAADARVEPRLRQSERRHRAAIGSDSPVRPTMLDPAGRSRATRAVTATERRRAATTAAMCSSA